MIHIDVVDAEGGPLLLADAEPTRLAWRGTDDSGADYERACNIVENAAPDHSIDLGESKGIVWDMEGAGTADVFIDLPKNVLILRAWIKDDDGMEVIFKLAEAPISDGVSLGTLDITSGVLIVLSATESGECIQIGDEVNSVRPTGDMSSETSGLLIHVPTGRYFCVHDEVSLEDGQNARRCHVILQ